MASLGKPAIGRDMVASATRLPAGCRAQVLRLLSRASESGQAPALLLRLSMHGEGQMARPRFVWIGTVKILLARPPRQCRQLQGWQIQVDRPSSAESASQGMSLRYQAGPPASEPRAWADAIFVDGENAGLPKRPVRRPMAGKAFGFSAVGGR
jgi:hypothetical protein